MQGQIQVVWETVILVRGPNLWSPNIIFQVLIFQLYFNKNVLKLAINNFTMHLIILKWLRRQKCRQKRKTMRQRDVKARKEIICKCSLLFWFLYEPVPSHWVTQIVCTTCRTFLAQIPLQLLQVYSHTGFVHEYINSLKIIDKGECFVM